MTGPNPPAPHMILRAATGQDHARVDAAFAGFDLADRIGYAGFLDAHARALPAAEAALAGDPALPALRPRAPLLAADLAALDRPLPPPLPIDLPAAAAARFGMLYVIEGSRLGGGMLARSVAAGLPHAYLSAVHLPGEWRGFLAELDRAAIAGGEAWQATMLAGARRAFDLYEDAARLAAA